MSDNVVIECQWPSGQWSMYRVQPLDVEDFVERLERDGATDITIEWEEP